MVTTLTRADVTWCRALHYGGPHACLWIAMLPDGGLHVRSEWQWPRGVISVICRDIRIRTRELGIETVRYTVADRVQLVGKETEDAYGETRLETFRAQGLNLRVETHDPVQGWTRVQELFAARPDGRPWLTIHPSCVQLIRALTNAVSDSTNPEDVTPFSDDQTLRALRIGVMSRPTPKPFIKPPLPKNAVGRLLDEVRRGGDSHRWLAWR